MGLAPQVVQEIFEIVKDLNAKRERLLPDREQNTNMALRYATYGYIMETAASSWTARPRRCARTRTSRNSTSAWRGRQEELRDVKHYKRRKRWLA